MIQTVTQHNLTLGIADERLKFRVNNNLQENLAHRNTGRVFLDNAGSSNK